MWYDLLKALHHDNTEYSSDATQHSQGLHIHVHNYANYALSACIAGVHNYA